MTKILICWFSGTGNTKSVVSEYKKAFEENGAAVTLHNIDTGDYEGDIAEFDSVGVAYPIHAFNAPSNVLDFARNLQKRAPVGKKNLFIIKTSGEPLKLNNISSIKLRKILKKKFVLTNEYHYCMPYNIIFRHTDEMANRMWNAAKKVIPVDCKDILSGKSAKLKPVFCGGLVAWLFRIEHWGGRFNGRFYKVNESCIHCGKCERDCPTHNITITDGKFKFGKHCLMCMRCSFDCPSNAIKIGLFDKWKVNGAYSFLPPAQPEQNKHEKYCKKAYKKYFESIEERANRDGDGIVNAA